MWRGVNPRSAVRQSSTAASTCFDALVWGPLSAGVLRGSGWEVYAGQWGCRHSTQPFGNKEGWMDGGGVAVLLVHVSCMGIKQKQVSLL